MLRKKLKKEKVDLEKDSINFMYKKFIKLLFVLGIIILFTLEICSCETNIVKNTNVVNEVVQTICSCDCSCCNDYYQDIRGCGLENHLISKRSSRFGFLKFTIGFIGIVLKIG